MTPMHYPDDGVDLLPARVRIQPICSSVWR
jgi:hypothetical protein